MQKLVLSYHQLCLDPCVICWVFPCFSFCKNLPPKSKRCPKSKLKVKVLNWNDQFPLAHSLRYLRCVERWPGFSGSGAALWGKWISIRITAPNPMHPEHVWAFLNHGLPGAKHPQMPRAYCTLKHVIIYLMFQSLPTARMGLLRLILSCCQMTASLLTTLTGLERAGGPGSRQKYKSQCS
jgi:hypothetical protein